MKAAAFTILVPILLLLGAARAVACECSASDDPAAIEDEIRSADLVATVKVTGFKDEEVCEKSTSGENVCRPITMALITIIESVKGGSSGVVELDVAIGTSCDPGLEIGEQVFVMAYRDPEVVDQAGSVRYAASVCSMDTRNNGAIPLEFSAYRKKTGAG